MPCGALSSSFSAVNMTARSPCGSHSDYPSWNSFPSPLQVLETAARRNITLDFDLDKLSCVKTSRTFNATLQEVKDWMDRNPQEVVILYLDTKFDPLPPAAEQGNRDILGVFGDMVYKVSQGSPLNRTVKSLIEAGKHRVGASGSLTTSIALLSHDWNDFSPRLDPY